MSPLTRSHTLTIAAAGTISDAMTIGESSARGAILVPAAFSGTTLTFQASASLAGTYAAVRDSSDAEVSLSVTTSAWHELPAEVLTHGFAKVVSDAPAEPVEQSLVVVTKVPM